MNLKLTLAFLTLLIFFLNADAKLSAESWESIEKWTDVCAKGTQTNDVNTAVELINALGKAIPYAGPFATIFSVILSSFGTSDLQEIKNKLHELDKKLDDIDRHIGQVIIKIEEVAIETQYKNQVKYLRDLKDEYQRFVGNPTNITRHDFYHKCGDLKAIEFIHYIDREMNNEAELLPLRKVMANDFDIAKVNEWSGRIATILADASFLHFTCVGASGFSSATINKTLDGPNGDKAIVKRMLDRISGGIQRIKSNIEQNFFSHAKDEVDYYLSHYEYESHSWFSDFVYNQLTQKYPFRDWYVASWKTNGESYHWMHWHYNVNSNYWHKAGKNNRCLIVAAAPPGRSESSYAARRASCLSGYDGSSSARRIEESLESCLGNWELVAVVYQGRLQVSWRGTAAYYYTYAHINRYHYHITTIPSDNTPSFYSDVSNRTAVIVVGEPEDVGGGASDDFEDDSEDHQSND